MSKKNQNVSVARKGMNRDVHESNLSENDYTFALNTLIQDEIGSGYNLQNEPSNILAENFPVGFEVLRHEYDVNTNRTFYFLKNEDTGVSEIGYIENYNTVVNEEDTEVCCGNKIATPLEDIVQAASQNYVTLLNDSCNLCLNFSVYRPISKIIVKYEHAGTKIFWADPVPRYLDLSNLEQYLYTGSVSCGEDNTTPTCLDCEKLKVFRDSLHPIIQPETIELGGNLRAGMYEVQVAYCDLGQNEISSYYSATDPVSIFDENNTLLTQPELEYETSFGIKLKIDNLDTRYPYYKISIIYTGAISGTTFYTDGIFSTTDTEVTITSLQNLQKTTLSRIQVPKKTYEAAEGLTASNGTLFWHGYSEKAELNLQPVVNLLGAFVRWQTVETTEDLYKNGINTSVYKSLMRDEVYPLSVEFEINDGGKTAAFPLINRPPTEEELGQAPNNLDTQSINAYAPDCSDTDRTKVWQFYNTATDEGFYDSGSDDNYIEVDREEIKTCIILDVHEESEMTINLACDSNYTTLDKYIEINREAICEVGSEFYDEILCDILSDNYEDQICDTEELFGDNCGLTPELIEGSTIISLESVATEVVDTTYAEIEDMEPTPAPTTSNQYVFGSETNGRSRDTTFENTFFYDCDPPIPPIDPGNLKTVYRRNSVTNIACNSALTLVNLDIVTPSNNIGRYLTYYGDTTLTDLYQTKSSTAATNYGAFLHKGATWYKYKFDTEETEVIIEITSESSCVNSDSISLASNIRLTTFTNCSTLSHTFSQVVDLDTGVLLQFDKSDYPTGTIYIAIDAPITNITCDEDVPKYIVTPTCGNFAVGKRDKECTEKSVTITEAVFSKKEKYSNICTFKIPANTNCNPAPYKYGKFGYWESIEGYPDNEEMYDSSNLVIDSSDIPVEFQAEFNEYFSDTSTLDFRCKPIRHYRTPDFEISPFMSNQQLPSFSKSFIYPLGITINENLINAFLDIAVNNNLITQQQREGIVGYKILRGDRTLNKSVLAKGLLYDMFDYQDGGSKVLFPNFPYNDNNVNTLIYTDSNRNDLIDHPNGGAYNNNFTFHSPETSFEKIPIPNELKIEAYQYGYSKGNYVRVKEHPRYVVLGEDAYSIATTLAIIEEVLEVAIKVGELTAQQFFTFGLSNGASLGLVGAGIVTAAYAVGAYIKVGEYRKEWLDIITNLGQPKNFATYYTSIGNYNRAIANTEDANRLRAIKTSRNIKPGLLNFAEERTGSLIKINNQDRESSVFISTGTDFPINYPTEYIGYDNSRAIMSDVMDCEDREISSDLERNIASPYISLKTYKPNQYGKIGDIKWLELGKTRLLKDPIDFPQFFGGDIFISRFSTRTKFPLFRTTAMGLADRTPFNYLENSNIGSSKFYADFYVTNTNGFNSLLFPQVDTNFLMDCEAGKYSTYLRHPSKFYLSYQGTPTFLVESEVNNNYRYGKERPENNFYPNNLDYIESTQEVTRPIRYDNTFFYNRVYSKNITPTAVKTLPNDFSRAYDNILRYQPNGTFYSQQDNNENSKLEPWISYKPLNRYTFKSDLGKLVDLSDIESTQVLARFENGLLRYNAIDVLRERAAPETLEIGNAGIFAQRPLEFKRTKLGYSGSQHTAMISCEFGHFWADAKRGQIFCLDQSGEQLEDITQGISRWLKEQLPFKILKYNIQGITNRDLDNSYIGIGITMAWDSKNKRVILTKLDKKPLINNVSFNREVGFYTLNEEDEQVLLDINNPLHFEDCSFTIAYSPLTKSWISYHSYKPNYYVSLQDYFQSGVRTKGVWSHLLTNKSFCVFYGEKFDWIIEFPAKTTYTNNILQNITYWLESRRYANEYDYSSNREIGFDKMCIYNHNNNSGILNLVTEQPNNLFQKTKYPIQRADSQDILATSYDKKWTVNFFFNRVKKDTNNVPQWLKDNIDVNKSINLQSLTYNQVSLDRIRGDYFLIRLYKTENTQFKTIFKFNVSNELSY